MLKSLYTTLLLVFAFVASIAQVEKEVNPPYNIKTISFLQNGQNIVPIFQLGDTFQLAFDDLFGNEANYYYQIVHCDYDWQPSQLSINEYMQGFDNQRIQDYTNSYNTLQIYSHYKIQFPNRNTRLLVSGNFMIKIVNEDREVVFSRKFIVYENIVTVTSQVKRARNINDTPYKHNIEFTIKSNNITFQSPLTNVKILLLQNGQLNTGITNIKPMYTIGNDLIYKYDAETQFWGGNEFRWFENKDIRNAVSNIARIDAQGGVYNGYLYTDEAKSRTPYSYNPDLNGNFVIKNINAENNEIEADYAWIFFTLSAPSNFEKKDIYVNGMFNNYALSAENKMDYNAEKSIYEKAIMIKQGFTNYKYVIANKLGKIDAANAIDGNFYQTVNDYFTLVYYKENNQRYHRIIGKSVVSSENIIN